MPNREMGIGGLIRGAPGPVIGIVGCVLSPWLDVAGLGKPAVRKHAIGGYALGSCVAAGHRHDIFRRCILTLPPPPSGKSSKTEEVQLLMRDPAQRDASNGSLQWQVCSASPQSGNVCDLFYSTRKLCIC